MRQFDDLIRVDGAHTVWVDDGQIEIIPASRVYAWRRDEPALAWPLHQDLGQTAGTGPIREHESLPALEADVAARTRWDPARYETAVAAQLERVFATRSGARLRAVLDMQVTIMPFPIRDPANRDGDYRPNAAPRARASDRSLYIVYTPGHFLTPFRASSLFHELVHVYRIMAGVYRPRVQARSPFRYTAWEEFPAVCVENVFRSEVGLPLRWGHYDLTRELLDPDTWLAEVHNRLAVERLIREMPRLTDSLAELNVAFNPFRDIARERVGRRAVPRPGAKRAAAPIRRERGAGLGMSRRV